MSNESKNNASAIRHKRLKLRSKVIAAIRAWLDKEGFIEVQTPLLIDAPAPEPYIETFSIPDAIQGRTLYLIPSPELNLKRLLAEGFKRIYQMGPVFRKNERGERHLSEFTLLEWYRTDADYRDLMADCEAIVQVAARASGFDTKEIVYGETSIDIRPPFLRITVEEAFMKYAGWRPGPNPDQHRFDEDMATKIEPGLPRDRPVFLMDYPASCAALARLKPDNPSVAERVELYMGGLELSNGFSELTDQFEQEQRFKKDLALRKKLGLEVYPLPRRFISCLKGLPPCAGMALGIDRLIMLLSNALKIDDVVAFTHEVL
ncbi:MAG: EF-P lysine aminoacylase EpmA [Dissulfurimicrobium sp.]|uniref:EF-P lysine aminoacylase EpmA n=1 Tax=Dissulfurimicrobium sp. TaxID=2022436 RepID=UPI00404A325C